MAKKQEKSHSGGIVPSATQAGASVKVPKVMAYELRDSRNRGVIDGGQDPAMERIWRNCMYPERITFNQFYRMYARNNIAARVIETFPDYCWSIAPFIDDKGGPDGRFSKEVREAFEKQYSLMDGVKQDLFTSMKQLDVLGGIGGEALMVFGFKDGRSLDTPVKPSKGMELEWVKLLHNGQFEVAEYDEEKTSKTFGDVILFETKDFTTSLELNFSSHIAPGRKIHATRCVHFKDTNGLAYGTSRIQKCYNQLIDITKLSGASAEVYWLGAFSGLSVETDPLATLGDDEYNRMKEEVQKYFDGLARSLIFEGAKSKLLYPAIVSPKDHFDLLITMISIATAIPRRFLTGAEAAKLASQQDTLNWDDRVKNRREMFCGPNCPIVQRLIDAGVIRQPRGGMFSVYWSRQQSIALDERADSAYNMTEALNTYFESGMADVIPFVPYLMYICGYSEEEAKAINDRVDWAKHKAMIAEKKDTEKTKPSLPLKKVERKSVKEEDTSELSDRIGELETMLQNLTAAYQMLERKVEEDDE